ncbi:hypothetical protein AZE42_10718 [Rhizopogon vesiculosus]|uniref:Uncharacterized protein n=1 Tax=Rhizopogon vesiculosus TaxID=180088 RepID=A0A1J8QR93_9AGAM|nr:hypothetical protein AZE42_10718 [Rhizopogon vesiculosus]
MFNHFYIALENVPFADFANETYALMAANVMISVVDLIGDLLLLYRCWLVWGEKFYVIALPLLTAFGGFGCILPIPALLLVINPTSPVPPTAIVPLTIAGYVLPLCTNVMATGLIAGRIWYISRIAVMDEHGKRVTKRVPTGGRSMMLVIESGALYLVTQLIFVILVATRNPAEAVLSLAGTQIYVSSYINIMVRGGSQSEHIHQAIASTLIIIRVGMGISSEQTMSPTMDSHIEFWSQKRSATGMRTVGTWRNDNTPDSPSTARLDEE